MTILSVLLLALAQSAASASDVECIVDATSAADRLEMVAGGRSGEGLDGEPLNRLIAAVAGCQAGSTWSQARLEGATAAAMATIIRDDSAAALTAAGVASQAIDRWFDGQDSSVRTNLAISEADIVRLLESLHEAGVSEQALEPQAELVGVYFGTLILLERIALGLPLQ